MIISSCLSDACLRPGLLDHSELFEESPYRVILGFSARRIFRWILTLSLNLYNKKKSPERQIACAAEEILRTKKALYILSIWVGFGWWESEDVQGQKDFDHSSRQGL
jgi:hypothetical protein